VYMTEERHRGIHKAVSYFLRDTNPIRISSQVDMWEPRATGVRFTVEYADRTVCFKATNVTTAADIRDLVK
jgi:hypothetical protein